MNLLPDYDYSACRKNARDVLSQYRKLSRIVGEPLTSLQSPTISDMPAAPAYGNNNENKQILVADAKDEFNKLYTDILKAVKSLPQTHFQLIYYTYMTRETFTDIQIADMVFNSISANKTVVRQRAQALIEFCEAYQNGKLLVFKMS